MFPIRDHNPSLSRPFVIYALIALNVLVFALQLPYMADERALTGFWGDRALYPVAVTRDGDYTGIFTSMFLHAGILHILGNMLFLWIFGDNLEDQMGHLGFLLFYLASGIAAALVHIVAAPVSHVPTVGASGAIAGVMGGYLLMFPKARVDVAVIIVIFIRVFTLPAWIMLGFWFALQIFGGVGTSIEGGGVAYWAHAGGFLAGLALALPLWLRRGGPAFWDRTHGRPPHPEVDYTASRVPTVRRRR
ncbi:rhomboid family intramembrane serine protease [Albidovulum sp.]|uniref:rhomboid family intramembrane serine protease n=1 Tax=Albidovulum sp. TaxID=1872424 RepID=UPI0039B8C6CF